MSNQQEPVKRPVPMNNRDWFLIDGVLKDTALSTDFIKEYQREAEAFMAQQVGEIERLEESAALMMEAWDKLLPARQTNTVHPWWMRWMERVEALTEKAQPEGS